MRGEISPSPAARVKPIPGKLEAVENLFGKAARLNARRWNPSSTYTFTPSTAF